MGWKSSLIRPLAKREWRRIAKMKENALEDQRKTFQRLIFKATDTAFGKAHGFSNIKSPEDFRERIAVTDYEGRKQWFERIASGEADVCWPGKPKYLSKTSGTTSGVKYIPITHDSIGGHIRSARNALLNYAVETGNYRFFDGKLIFLSGSPELQVTNGIPTGRLSGISNHEVPFWLKPSQVPSFRTNCIDDWEQKVKAIVEETVEKD
ncbi:MAG TPA: GH3 auxin-responsive promoter family protein, partial [Saprospiraceae bacterium]|nr:GH3 auxin-responsive promoter family protein [Saprospiraceae bacterium]